MKPLLLQRKSEFFKGISGAIDGFKWFSIRERGLWKIEDWQIFKTEPICLSLEHIQHRQQLQTSFHQWAANIFPPYSAGNTIVHPPLCLCIWPCLQGHQWWSKCVCPSAGGRKLAIYLKLLNSLSKHKNWKHLFWIVVAV